MIVSFKCKHTEAVRSGKYARKFGANVTRTIARKLRQLDAVVTLSDLNTPPGNRLEALAGDRKGQHSIRVNDQWRICFVWTDKGPEDVECVDYH